MFYRITSHPNIPPHHEYGYEDKYEFFKAIRKLAEKYGNRIGECIDTRHAFLMLNFADMPGRPAKAWLPAFMCEPAPPPTTQDEDNDPLDGVFGEGW